MITKFCISAKWCFLLSSQGPFWWSLTFFFFLTFDFYCILSWWLQRNASGDYSPPWGVTANFKLSTHKHSLDYLSLRLITSLFYSDANLTLFCPFTQLREAFLENKAHSTTAIATCNRMRSLMWLEHFQHAKHFPDTQQRGDSAHRSISPPTWKRLSGSGKAGSWSTCMLSRNILFAAKVFFSHFCND